MHAQQYLHTAEELTTAALPAVQVVSVAATCHTTCHGDAKRFADESHTNEDRSRGMRAHYLPVEQLSTKRTKSAFSTFELGAHE